MSIKKTLATGIATVSLLASVALPAFAANDKGPLYDNPTGNCTDGATGGTAEGFVSLNEVGTDVHGVVSLKGAMPNKTYNVTLLASDGSCTPIASLGTITTNGQGNGNLSAPKTSVAGQPGWFVAAINTENTDSLASPAVQ